MKQKYGIMQKESLVLLIFVLVFSLNGCSGLWRLYRYSQETTRQENLVSRQEAEFLRVYNAALEGRIKKGMPKGRILKVYGSPFMCRGPVWVYKGPLLKDRRRVYIDFDGSGQVLDCRVVKGIER